MGCRGRGSGSPSVTADRRDRLGLDRWADLQRGRASLRVQASEPYTRSFGFHELWHLFVVAGSACHFWAVLSYVAVLA
jgi:predicted membrane channel-forming protein YqfA (hemolysin III family)